MSEQAWDSATTYEVGDEIIHTTRKVVYLTGLSWLWAKLTGKPTQWTEEGKPQVYRAVTTPAVGSFDGWEERPRVDYAPIPDFFDEDRLRRSYAKAVEVNGPPKGVTMIGGKPGHSYCFECSETGRVYYGTADESGHVEAVEK